MCQNLYGTDFFYLFFFFFYGLILSYRHLQNSLPEHVLVFLILQNLIFEVSVSFIFDGKSQNPVVHFCVLMSKWTQRDLSSSALTVTTATFWDIISVALCKIFQTGFWIFNYEFWGGVHIQLPDILIFEWLLLNLCKLYIFIHNFPLCYGR